MSTTSRTVSFRLGPDHYGRLKELGDAVDKSPGDFARLQLLEHLDGDDRMAELTERLTRMEKLLTGDAGRAEMMERFTRIENSLADVRHDLPLTARALLIAAGQRAACTPEAAEKWAQENLKTQD